jgi:putative membrane protein
MFLKLILRWAGISCAVWVTSQIIPGIAVNPWWVSFIVGACLTVFNMIIKPIVSILTLPLNIVTLGLFSFVINSAVFWYLGTFITGFSVTKFSAAFFGAILVSIISWVFKMMFPLD